MTNKMLGFLFLALSAVLFSTKGILLKLLYSRDMDVLSIMVWRGILSLPLFWVAVCLKWNSFNKRERMFCGKNTINICLLGFLGYYLASYLDLTGLQYVSVGLERMILYIYPTMVLMLSIFFKNPNDKNQEKGGGIWFSVILCYVGIVISYMGQTEGVYPEKAKGSVLVFLSAFCYAVFLLLSSRLVQKNHPFVVSALSMTVSTISVCVHYWVVHRNIWVPALSLEAFVLCGSIAVFSTFVPVLLVNVGLRWISAGQAAVASTIGPISTLFMGALVLGEIPGVSEWVGLILVLLGGVLLALRSIRTVGK